MDTNELNFKVKNITKYSVDTYQKLNNVLFNKRIMTISFCCGALIIIGLSLIIFNFLQLIGYIYICVGVFIPIFAVLRLKSLIKKSIVKNAEANGDISITYYFYNKYVELRDQRSENRILGKVQYDHYQKVIETNEYFFLFFNDNNANCVSKNDSSFIIGDNLVLRNVLKTECRKYIVKCK